VPTFRVLDPVTHTLRPVAGSQIVPDSLTVTQIPGTTRFRIRVVFDATSDPRLTELGGTIFTISIPVDPAPRPVTPVSSTTAVLASAAPAGTATDAANGLSVSFERTGFVGGSQRTLATTRSENYLTNAGTGGPESRPSDLAMAQEVMSAAHAGFWAD